MSASREEALAWEQRSRVPAGAAGIAAGLLTLLGTVLAFEALKDGPRVLLTDALREAAGAPADPRGLLTARVAFYADKLGGAVLPTVLVALGSLGTAVLLGYLSRATRHRNPGFARVGLVAAVVGAVMAAVGAVVGVLALKASAQDYVDAGTFSSQAARDAINSPTRVVGAALQQFAVLPLGLGFVLICLNAMRVGLLTRFMGILGVIVGALLVFPIDQYLGAGTQLPVVECFWLIAAGALVLGFWPRAVPPAWRTGEAMPWPTQQELREMREAERAPAAPERPAAAAGTAGSRAKKKRKKR